MAIWAIVLLVFVLVILPVHSIYRPPNFVIKLFQRSHPEVLYRVDTSKKIIALTIDDAPSQHTDQILEVLKVNDMTATFFVIGGQVAGRQDLLVNILKSGSEIANHAMHDEPSISLPSDILEGEIKTVDGLLAKAYLVAEQERPDRKYFRPGSGIFSSRILDVAARLGHMTVLGNIYPHDPFIPYWRINAWHVLSMIQPGSVIICHDRRSWTVPMLSKVLPELKRRGYEVVTVSRLLDETDPWKNT